jgi:hypothetical protein
MKIRFLAVAALAGLISVSACKKSDGEGDANGGSDTTVVPGTDTISQPTVVPAPDTIISDTTVHTDTIQGQANEDSAKTVTP